MSLPSTARRAAFVGALVSAGLVAAFAVTSPGPAAIQTGDCTPGSTWPAQNGSLASQVLSLVNQHRAAMGEGQLVTSPTLSASAVWKARHMAAFNYFSHDDPGPPVAPTPARTAADRVATCGYRASWGENIAEGFTTAQSVLNAWLNSAGHKANIENASYAATGVGVATAANGAVYWVQDFGYRRRRRRDTSRDDDHARDDHLAGDHHCAHDHRAVDDDHGAFDDHDTCDHDRPGSTTTTTPQGAQVALRLATVHAGVHARRLALTTKVSWSGAAATAVHVKCAAQIGKRSLRVVANVYRGDLARCAWRLPRDVRLGARARGWIRVTQGPLHVRRAFGLKLG